MRTARSHTWLSLALLDDAERGREHAGDADHDEAEVIAEAQEVGTGERRGAEQHVASDHPHERPADGHAHVQAAQGGRARIEIGLGARRGRCGAAC
ncbi:MAG: hypothetical protein QOI71_3585 [Gaiellales bacterium]|nr:hypothetical protein [Gaiellales bacterium]